MTPNRTVVNRSGTVRERQTVAQSSPDTNREFEDQRRSTEGGRVSTRRVDVRTQEWDGETWDLVSSQFMHLPDGRMVDLVGRLASAVAPGGTLLVVGHHPDDMATGLRHGHHSFLFTAESLLPALGSDFVVEVCESRPRTATHPHSGEEIAITDAVLRARRIA